MPRPATGNIVPPTGSRKSWGIRYRANGERINETLGKPEDGWTETKAREVLDDRLAEIRLGTWKPKVPEPKPAPPRESPDPTFREFAERWYSQNLPDWRANTVRDYKGSLERDLLPFFADYRLSEITAEVIDRYTAWKRSEGKISNNTINKCLSRLAQIMSLAEDYGYIEKNAAAGKKRRLKGEPRSRIWVMPEQLPTLLDSCGNKGYRPLVAMMAGAGLRVGEAVALTWGDVSLFTSSVRVRDAKTAAGIRTVDLPRGLAIELEALFARSHQTGPNDPVFRSRDGAQQNERNAQARLKPAIAIANKRLAELGIEPLSEKTSPHSLRRCFASMRFALGDDPVYVASMLGHTAASFSMSVYASAVKRRERLSGAHLEEFDRACEWARMGANSDMPVNEEAANPLTEPIEP